MTKENDIWAKDIERIPGAGAVVGRPVCEAAVGLAVMGWGGWGMVGGAVGPLVVEPASSPVQAPARHPNNKWASEKPNTTSSC